MSLLPPIGVVDVDDDDDVDVTTVDVLSSASVSPVCMVRAARVAVHYTKRKFRHTKRRQKARKLLEPKWLWITNDVDELLYIYTIYVYPPSCLMHQTRLECFYINLLP